MQSIHGPLDQQLTLGVDGAASSPLQARSLPDGSWGYLFDMGDVIVNDRSSRTLTVTNNQSARIKLQIRPTRGGARNRGAFAPLDLTPVALSIDACASAHLRLEFAPDRKSLFFFKLFRITADEAACPFQTPLALLLVGRAWTTSRIIRSPQPDPPLMTSVDDALIPGGETRDDEEDLEDINIELVPSNDNPAVCTLHVHNILPQQLAIKPAPLEVVVQGLTDQDLKIGFSVEPMKFTLEPGKSEKLSLQFAPNRAQLMGSRNGLIASFGVSQWLEASFTCSLKGGFPPAPNSSTLQRRVRIRGFLGQT